MSLWTGSLTGRSAGYLQQRLAPVWCDSLLGRLLAGLWAAFAAACSGSSLLSSSSAVPRPIDTAAGSGSAGVVRVPVRAWLWLERVLGGGWVGRTARRAGAMVGGSALLAGQWARVGGALVAGAAVARLWRGSLNPLDAAALAVLSVVGLGAVALGPRLVRWWTWSLSGRAFGSESGREAARPRGGRAGALVVGAAAATAAAVGVLAGSVSGSGGVVAIAAGLVVCVGVFALYRPEFLLLVLAAFPWVNWVARKALAGTPLAGASDDLLLVGSLVCLVFCVLVVRRWELRTVPILLPLAVAVTAALGSVCLNSVPADVAVFALRVTFEPLIFYFLGLLLPKDARWVRMAVGVFIAAGVALALHGIYQYLTHAPMPAKWVDVREVALGTRAYSIVENPNGLGAFLIMGVCLCVGFALGRLTAWLRVVFAVAGAILMGGVAVTFSRGAWIGLVLGLVAMLALSRPKLLGGLAVLGALSPLVLPKAIVDRFTFAFSSAYMSKSAQGGRLLMWDVSLWRIAENPWFGVGLGTFGGTSAFMFGYSRLWVDNFYLQMGAEGGLLLLVAFLWILWRAGKGLVAGHRLARDPFLRALTVGALGSFVAVAVANFTASVWETLVVGAGFWFLTGLAGSLPTGESESARLTRVRDLTAEVPVWTETESGPKSAGDHPGLRS